MEEFFDQQLAYSESCANGMQIGQNQKINMPTVNIASYLCSFCMTKTRVLKAANVRYDDKNVVISQKVCSYKLVSL